MTTLTNGSALESGWPIGAAMVPSREDVGDGPAPVFHRQSTLSIAWSGIGDAVVVLDDFSTGRRGSIRRHADSATVRIVEGTILDDALVETLVGDCDRVFHLAAAVGVAHIIADPLGSIQVNSRGTAENILAAMRARHGRKLLISSSSEVYGRGGRVPMHEDDDRILGSTVIQRWSYMPLRRRSMSISCSRTRHTGCGA